MAVCRERLKGKQWGSVGPFPADDTWHSAERPGLYFYRDEAWSVIRLVRNFPGQFIGVTNWLQIGSRSLSNTMVYSTAGEINHRLLVLNGDGLPKFSSTLMFGFSSLPCCAADLSSVELFLLSTEKPARPV